MEYNTLGLGVFKYNQIILFVFSLLTIGVNYLLGSSLSFWLFLIIGLTVVNAIWYSFNDIKYNREKFIIEKFLIKREVPSDMFLKIERLPFNIFVVKFTNSKAYYMGDFKSIFQDSAEITESVRSQITA